MNKNEHSHNRKKEGSERAKKGHQRRYHVNDKMRIDGVAKIMYKGEINKDNCKDRVQ